MVFIFLIIDFSIFGFLFFLNFIKYIIVGNNWMGSGFVHLGGRGTKGIYNSVGYFRE